jgi:hypothetical protein
MEVNLTGLPRRQTVPRINPATTQRTMNATRILPDLQCSLICEDIRQEANGNCILIGVLSVIRVPKLPVVAFRLLLFNRWTAGVGQFTETIRLIAPDQMTVLRKAEMKFALQDPALSSTNVIVLPQVEFKTAGTYFVEVVVDDVMKLRYPLPVVQLKLPEPTAGSGAAPAVPPANPAA